MVRRTDNFFDVINEWAVTSCYRQCDVTRLSFAVACEALNSSKCTVEEALKVGIKVKELRNIGKLGYQIYQEFTAWATQQIELQEEQTSEKNNNLNEIVIGCFYKYEIDYDKGVCALKFWGTKDKHNLYYKVSIIDGLLFIYKKNENGEYLIIESVLSNFYFRYIGDL